MIEEIEEEEKEQESKDGGPEEAEKTKTEEGTPGEAEGKALESGKTSEGGKTSEVGKTPEQELEIKVDGQVLKKPISEILKLAEKASGADRRFAEAKEIREAAKEVFGLLQPDRKPEDALADLWKGFYKGDGRKAGQAFLGMSERVLSSIIENDRFYPEVVQVLDHLLDKAVEIAGMHPSQREAQWLKRELEERDRLLKEKDAREELRQEERLQAEGMEAVAGEIVSALKDLQLPSDSDTQEAVLETWLLLRQSEPDADAKAAAQEWQERRGRRDQKEKQKLVEEHWKEMEALPEEQVLSRIPQSTLDKILKATLQKTKADRRPTPTPREDEPSTEKPERPRRVASYNLFRK